MASISELSKLFQAIASSDLASARALAEKLTANFDQRGQHSAARSLRGSLTANGAGVETPRVFQAWSGFQLNGALTRLLPRTRLEDIALKEQTRKMLQELLDEWGQREKLKSRQIEHRSRLIFFGPPGCGKTLTAQAIALELGIPSYLVRVDTLIGAYLGETARHIREVFRFAERTPVVLVLDEIDAIGKRRGDPMEVGELNRIVISLMQELEHSKPKGLIIAASNLPDSLDEALWRRFDATVEFPSPSQQERNRFARRRAAALNLRFKGSLRSTLRGCRSYADVDRAISSELRRIILTEKN